MIVSAALRGLVHQQLPRYAGGSGELQVRGTEKLPVIAGAGCRPQDCDNRELVL